jgi:two-component system, cell cycle sensor histidine kinase and response regulator CckA
VNRFKQLSVGQQVSFTFGTLCSILLLIGGLLFFGLRSVDRSNRLQLRATDELALIDDTAQDVGQMQAEVLREVLETDDVQIMHLDQSVRDMEKSNASELAAYQLFIDTEEERQLYGRVIQARKAYWEQTLPVLRFSLANRDAEAIALIHLKQAPAYDAFLKTVGELIKYVEKDARDTAGATSRFITAVRIAGNTLVGVAILIAIGTGFAVAGVLRRFKKDNNLLETEITERKQAEDELIWKTAFLEAQVNSSIDGILVVDEQGRQILRNQRMIDLFNIPQHIADDKDDTQQLHWVADVVKNREQFMERVAYLYSHPNEIGRDEVELKNGTILDRYSSPVVGKDEKYYGRIWAFRDMTARRRDEENLRESKHFAESIAENSTSIIYLYDLQTSKSVYSNRNAAEALGFTQAQIMEMGDTFLPMMMHPEDLPRIVQQHTAYAEVTDNRVFDLEFRMKDAAGDWHWMWARETVFNRQANGAARQILGTAQDITQRKRLEEQLFQSQKMETVGKLAGGIAHEFNSILTAIIGQSELLSGDLPAGSPLIKNTTEISKAASRAATLTRQLLAYGRKQLLQPEILDLNSIVAGMESTLHHLVGRGTDVSLVFAGPQSVKADAGQIAQVIMHMVMNAHDAMPNGGKLTLETTSVSFDEEGAGFNPELKPGDYVMLAITDTGTGMSEEVRGRVFEPFFTTKGVGQGTGLGLSTCYGIIKQSGGHISVYSEPGRGTSFKVYLPQVERETKAPIPRLNSPDLPRGTETILLVEDDPALREMAVTLLGRLGYTVLAAANGIEALSLKQRRDIGHIDLLFTDIVMPHMSGKELADRVRALYPHTRILFTSAYTENAIVHQGVLEKAVALLQKPFTPSALAHKLREVLDQQVAS